MTKHAIPLLLALSFAAAPALAQQQQKQLRTEWSKNVTEYRAQDGRLLTLVCPPDGRAGDVWGTDSYTDDSSVCSAAVHAGLITTHAGGVVTIAIGPGRPSYQGSTRNGVKSASFGHTAGSFTFRRGGEGHIDWATDAVGLSLAGRPLTVVCPPGGKANRGVWGTDIYTEDSSVCGAAVHAGLITPAAGGRVTLEDAGEQPQYAASERNGVSSREYARMPGFRFAGSAAAAAPTPAPTATTMVSTTREPVATAPAAASGSTGTVSGTPTTTAIVVGDRTPVARPSGSTMTPVALAAPTNVRAEPLYYRGTVMVHWDTVPGATGYDILQKLPDGKYAGANPYDRGPYGPERSQGITMPLAPGPLSFSVVAHYGPGEDSPPSASASVVIPRWSGRYRVSILGFKVERETSDDPLQTDGKHDEVYMRVAAAERGPEGDLIGPIVERQTLVHGDVNLDEWRSVTSPTHRIRAGSASVDGGLRTGDAVPSTTPWLRSTSDNYATTFPLLVWEGELMQGHNTVQVAFNLWEADRRPGQGVPVHTNSLEAMALDRAKAAAMRIEPTVASKVVANVTSDPTLNEAFASLLGIPSSYTGAADAARGMLRDKVVPRLPALTRAAVALDSTADEVGATALALKMGNALASQQSTVANAVTSYLGAVNDYLTAAGENLVTVFNAKDRPLGVRKDSRGVLVALPGALTLNFENAEREALAGNGPQGKGRGIYEYRFEDGVTSQGGNGRYVVYLQVERLQ